MSIVGPSGCGKTTLLRLVAGLESPSRGEILLQGLPAGGMPPHARNIAMVFQEPALFPHLSVEQNVGFGLQLRGLTPDAARCRVQETSDQLGISRLLARQPETLSGGEQQRVALARALARRPDILLLDEPLSALDAPTRLRLRMELRALHRRLGVTMLHVTHDQGEALALGDRVAVMRAGHIEQVGHPRELLDRPCNAFVAGFIGSPPMNQFPGELTIGPGGSRIIRCDAGFTVDLPPSCAPVPALHECQPVSLGIRPHHVSLVTAGAPAPGPGIPAVVRLVEPGLRSTCVHVETVRGLDIVAAVDSPGLTDGQAVTVWLDPKHVYVFGQDGNTAIFPVA